MKNRFLYFLILLYIILIYMPRIPIGLIPGISSILRTDTIVTFLFSFFCFIYIILYKKRFSFFVISLYLIVFLFSFEMGVFIYAPSFLLYFSFIAIIFLFEDVVKIVSVKAIVQFLRYFLFFNIIIHFFCLFSGFSLVSNSLGLDDDLLILGPYGILFAPYNFTILLVIGAFLEYFTNHKIYSIPFLIIFIALISANSRAGFGAFTFLITIESFFFSRNNVNRLSIIVISVMAIIFISSIDSLNIKSLSTFNNIDINEDASWLMRVESFNNWLNWLSPFKFFFGGGAQIFVTFVTQYGLPGPFDNLYLRIISELGVIGLILFLYWMLLFYNHNFKSRIFLYSIFWMFFFSFFNESFLAIKGGHLFWLFIALIKSNEFGNIYILPKSNSESYNIV